MNPRPLGWFIPAILTGMAVGCVAGVLLSAGALTTWKRIDYLPYAVSRVVFISPFGQRIWLETGSHEYVELDYPCSSSSCSRKIAALPEDPRADWGPRFALEENTDCTFERFTLPILRPVTSCVGGYYAVMDTYQWIYLAVTPNGEMWVWRSGNAGMLAFIVIPPILALVGAAAGAILSVLALIIWHMRQLHGQPKPDRPL